MNAEPQGTSRKLVVWGFILSTIFTSGLTLGGGYLVQAVQQAQSDRRSQIEQFRSPANKMDDLVRSFMERFLVGKSAESERRALQENILQQWNALERIQRRLPPEDVALTKRYQSEIVAVSTELDRLPAPGEAHALMQAIAAARDTRVDVSDALDEQASRWL